MESAHAEVACLLIEAGADRERVSPRRPSYTLHLTFILHTESLI